MSEIFFMSVGMMDSLLDFLSKAALLAPREFEDSICSPVPAGPENWAWSCCNTAAFSLTLSLWFFTVWNNDDFLVVLIRSILACFSFISISNSAFWKLKSQLRKLMSVLY